MAAVSKTVEHQKCLEGSTPSPSALMIVPLAERQRRQPSKLERRVRFPQGTLSSMLGDRLTVGRLALNQAMEVRFHLPELRGASAVLIDDTAPGQLLLVVTPGSEPGGRWFDSNPRNFEVQQRKSSDRMRSLS